MPYQMNVTIAEERIRDSGKVGRRVSSEDDLIRMLSSLLPGWDIDRATSDRGETQDEVVGSWGRPGLIVYHYPQLASMSSGGYSDALAGITMPEGMSARDRVFMFLYQDIGLMNELIVIHEAAHALTFDFDAGHSERWLDTYLEMLKKAGLQEAVNLISFMTGKSEMKFVEGARRRNTSLKKGAPFAGYDDFADCVSKNQDKDNPEAYCGAIKNKVEGRLLRPSRYRSIR